MKIFILNFINEQFINNKNDELIQLLRLCVLDNGYISFSDAFDAGKQKSQPKQKSLLYAIKSHIQQYIYQNIKYIDLWPLLSTIKQLNSNQLLQIIQNDQNEQEIIEKAMKAHVQLYGIDDQRDEIFLKMYVLNVADQEKVGHWLTLFYDIKMYEENNQLVNTSNQLYSYFISLKLNNFLSQRLNFYQYQLRVISIKLLMFYWNKSANDDDESKFRCQLLEKMQMISTTIPSLTTERYLIHQIQQFSQMIINQYKKLDQITCEILIPFLLALFRIRYTTLKKHIIVAISQIMKQITSPNVSNLFAAQFFPLFKYMVFDITSIKLDKAYQINYGHLGLKIADELDMMKSKSYQQIELDDEYFTTILCTVDDSQSLALAGLNKPKNTEMVIIDQKKDVATIDDEIDNYDLNILHNLFDCISAKEFNSFTKIYIIEIFEIFKKFLNDQFFYIHPVQGYNHDV